MFSSAAVHGTLSVYKYWRSRRRKTTPISDQNKSRIRENIATYLLYQNNFTKINPRYTHLIIYFFRDKNKQYVNVKNYYCYIFLRIYIYPVKITVEWECHFILMIISPIHTLKKDLKRTAKTISRSRKNAFNIFCNQIYVFWELICQ